MSFKGLDAKADAWNSHPAAARNGANVVLHHLGGPTIKEMTALVSELKELGAKHVVVEGDISVPEVSKLVSNRSFVVSCYQDTSDWVAGPAWGHKKLHTAG